MPNPGWTLAAGCHAVVHWACHGGLDLRDDDLLLCYDVKHSMAVTSQAPPIILSGMARGDRTEGELTVLVPVVGLQARNVQLAATINDWDNAREGKIDFNARELEIAASGGYNGVDHTFTVDVSLDELKTGFSPNIVKAVWLSSAGFDVKPAEIIVTPREWPRWDRVNKREDVAGHRLGERQRADGERQKVEATSAERTC